MKKIFLLTLTLTLLLFGCKDNKKEVKETETVKVETTSGNSVYDKLKSEYELFGKWKISNTIVNESYPYEIYKKGNEYIGVYPSWEFKTEILKKRGNNYNIQENKYGEYYFISDIKEMILYDKDGLLIDYKATKE